MSNSTALPSTTATRTSAPGSSGGSGGSRGLLWSLTGSQFGLYVVFGAVPSVLLAIQLSDALGDLRKAAGLAIITTVGAVAHMVWQPVVGLLSDRTRTRWGSRTPWAMGGAIVTLPVLWAMGFTETVWLLGVLYVISEIAMSSAEGALAAVLPERVPATKRGRFSAARGLGVMLGTVVGQAAGGLLGANILVAYLVLGALPLLFVTARIFVDPDPDNRGDPVLKADLRALVASYKIGIRTHQDFWWAWISRLLTYVGFFAVYGYVLYLFEDYVGLGDAAPTKVTLFAIVAAVGILSSTLPSGAISDRVGRRKVFVLISSAGIGVAWMIPLVWPTVTGMLSMALVGGLAFGCYQAVDFALMTQVLPRTKSYGQDLGIVTLASILPQVLAPAFAGTIVVVSGGYATLFPAGAVFAVLGGLAILRVRQVR